MYSYEITKKLGYPRTVFYEDCIVFYYKDGREVRIGTNDIDSILYEKPSLWNYIKAYPFFGGTFPGRMEIYLTNSFGNSLMNRVSTSALYLVKISHKEIYKLPTFYKQKMGLDIY